MKKQMMFLSLLVLSMNAFAAEKLNCRVTASPSTEFAVLKLKAHDTYGATLGGHDFEAFIADDSINMIITKPADASGDRESISTSQVKPSPKIGPVNMYLTNSREQFLLVCRVAKK